MLFIETSALNGNGINQLFNMCCNDIYEKIKHNYYDFNDERCGIKKEIEGNFELFPNVEDNKNVKEKKCCS